jgi:predicted lysophospholipase L1 biosynthesis ABC-type transport system permease subunit
MIAENYAQLDSTRRNAGYQRLADLVILASLPIAGCTLAVAVIAGLNDRKRPFSLLRLTGAPLTMLRRVVTIESAVPLLISAAVAIGTGFLAAYLFLRAQLDETLRAPGAGRRRRRCWDRRGPLDHRVDLPGAETHHRTGDRAQ